MPMTTGPERRLHPASFLFSMGAHLKSLLVPGAAVIFTAGSSGRDWEVWLMALLVPYTIAAIARSLSLRYRFDATEMVVRKGWFFRSERHIPYARIQNIDVVRNVFHRALGAAEVRVETASGGEPEAVLTVLPVDAVAEMRRFVFAGRQETDVAARVAEQEAPEDSGVLLRLRPGEILLYGFIESRGAVVMAGALGLAWEFGLFDRYLNVALDDDPLRRGVIRHLVRAAIGQGGASPLVVAQAAAAFAALLLILRLLSMAWAFVRLYGFTLRRAGEDVRVDYGLLTRISGTVPLQRIQTLTLSDSPLHRLFGRISAHVDTAGGDGGSAQPTRREPIAPILRTRDLDALLAALMPTVTLKDVAWQPAHPRAFRRVLVRGCVLAALGSALTASLAGRWTLALAAALLLWTWFYGRKYVAHLGWAFAGDAIAARTGWMWRRITIARFSKVQVVTERQSPFDRRLEMASVRVDTAGASHPLEMPFLGADTAGTLGATLRAQAAETPFRW